MGKQTNQQRTRDQHNVDTQVDTEKGRKLKEVRVGVSVVWTAPSTFLLSVLIGA